MFHPYEKSDIFAKSTWHQCEIPPMNCAAEEYSTPLCYFNYNNAFHLYFLYCDILYHSNKYISLIFASPLVYISKINICICLALSLHILHSWQTWCQNANFAPSKEIYQISGLHTRYRFSLEGSASKKPRGRKKKPDQAVISTAKIANVHVWPIFIRPRFRLVSKSCRRSCVSRALTGNSAP